ncbi:MAG TPA: trypsin-like peptidase domain-containing protein [Tepidisphaeraceae bacterium]|jgi:serine protease Do|nr:trypsin-like peptidase domain-containing protein [Tepidisphaeraceae bacterium]
MKFFKKGVTTLLVGAISIGSYIGVTSLVRDVHFAQAEDQVAASREDLKKVDDLANVYRAVGKAVEPSVVKIDVIKTVKGVHRGMDFGDDIFRRFFQQDPNDPQAAPTPRGRRFTVPNNPNVNPNPNDNNGDDNNDDSVEQEASGSGVIMEAADGKGYILTNNHVAGGADKLIVTLWDGRTIHKTKVLGTDPKSDLAVVQIEADKLIPAQWGDSDQLAKGDIIFAFGSPFGYIGSMTHGIVSALNRTNIEMPSRQDFRYENFIQVDAPINPGNSGGPLVNLHGEVVGINTAIATETGAFNGLGFAIPSDQAKNVFAQLKAGGKMVRGFIGVGIQDLNTQPGLAESFGYTGSDGALIGSTYPDTPAYGKLKRGDIVTAIEGKKVRDTNELRNFVASTKPGTELTFTIFRNNKSEDVKIKIGEQPEALADIRNHHEANGGNDNGGETSQSEATAKNLGLHLATPSDEMIQQFGLNDDVKGAIVTGVDRHSIAAKTGINPGDVITQVGGTDVESAKQAADALAKQDVSKGIRLSITNRQGSQFVLLRQEDQ